jgi:hypothetical protein
MTKRQWELVQVALLLLANDLDATQGADVDPPTPEEIDKLVQTLDPQGRYDG